MSIQSALTLRITRPFRLEDMEFRPLLTAQNCTNHVHLIIGSGPLSASRCSRSLQVGARPVVVAPPTPEPHFTLSKAIEDGKVQHLRREFQAEDLTSLGRDEVENVVDAIFVTMGPKHASSATISSMCRRLRIPVNVSDTPNLCTFTILSTHSDGPLQIGITTSGKGCKLSSRIRREVAASLPPNLGQAIDRLGTMRRRIWEEDHASHLATDNVLEIEDDDSSNQRTTFNALIDTTSVDPDIARGRRMRWLSQICEYWPLQRLASINDNDVSAVLAAYRSSSDTPLISGALPPQRGSITLAGSGPGHPSLLTIATNRAIKAANFILADKLVPSQILDLIPRRTPVHIARKFPGNAEAAQEELLTLALEGAKQGKHVLRLKQGDPYLYGRGAEEVAFFRAHGFKPVVLPGVTSALSGPMFADIPVTHRAVSDQVMICTGTGRKGAAPTPPSYSKNTTFVFLMALHRLDSLVSSLTNTPQPQSEGPSAAEWVSWPKQTPCAIVERASCPDQRVIRSTLEHVCEAVDAEGSQPPGLLVLGWSCEVLQKPNGLRWATEEGFRGLDDIGLDDLSLDGLESVRQVA